jgi:hypothetical protein
MRKVLLFLCLPLFVLAQKGPAPSKSPSAKKVEPKSDPNTIRFEVEDKVYELPASEGKLTYIIKDSVSKTKEQLFSGAKEWMGKNGTIQTEDKEAGFVIGKGSFKVAVNGYPCIQAVDIEETYQIDVKEGKYRMTVNNFLYKGTQTQTYDSPNPFSGSKVSNTQSFENPIEIYVNWKMCPRAWNKAILAVDKTIKDKSIDLKNTLSGSKKGDW